MQYENDTECNSQTVSVSYIFTDKWTITDAATEYHSIKQVTQSQTF